jgi:Eukaryotic aspartyl protease
MGGTVKGSLGKDALSANTFSWEQTFAVVESSSNSIGVPGIMGLSRGGCDSRGLCSLSYWPLKYSAIGFYYDPETWAGLFMAGFVDPATYCAEGTSLTYIPQVGSYYWAGKVGMSFNGASLGSNLHAIFDTGTTYFMMKQSLYNQVNTMLQASGGCASPTITLTISGIEFTIPTSVLVINNRSGRCSLRIDTFTNQINCDILVGATFLVNFYTVFDLAQDRIGFCPAKPGLTKTRRLQDETDLISALLDDPRRRHRYDMN